MEINDHTKILEVNFVLSLINCKLLECIQVYRNSIYKLRWKVILTTKSQFCMGDMGRNHLIQSNYRECHIHIRTRIFVDNFNINNDF